MMANVLVDTDVFSFAFKGDTRADRYRRHLDGNRLHLAFVTVAELYRWAVWNDWGARRTNDLRNAIRACVVLSYDDDTAWAWARVVSIKGRPVAPGDGWIAATAIRHGMPLVTHNRSHFENLPGLAIISEA